MPGSAPTAFDDKRDRLALPGIRSTDWLGDSLGRAPGTPEAKSGQTCRRRWMHAGVADPGKRRSGPEASRQEREDRKGAPRPYARKLTKLNRVIIREQTLPPNDQAQRPPPETPGRLQQSRPNYLNRPPAQRGGGAALWLGSSARILNRLGKLSIKHLCVIISFLQLLPRNWQKMLDRESLPQKCGQLLSRQLPKWLAPRRSASSYQTTIPIRLSPRT